MRVALVLLAAWSMVVALVRFWPRPPLSAAIPVSTVVVDADGRLLRLTLAADDRYRLWLPLTEFPADLIDAVLLHEDRWFHWHPGVDPVALVRAAGTTYLLGGRRQGGSTITMQLARLLHRLDTRKPSGKLVQIGHALWLELRYSKADILEAYLNLAPYGGNVEGIGAAAMIYFDKSPSALSLPESLALAVIPQAPNARGGTARSTGTGDRVGPNHASEPDRSGVAESADLRAAREHLYRRWQQTYPERSGSPADLRLPLALRRPADLPFRAPHLVDWLLAEQRRSGRSIGRIETTLDLRLQALLERQVGNHVRRVGERGIDNASVILIDWRDMAVKALVGSADYFDSTIEGQVDGTRGKRSPGSTLKPFVYALGIDQGVLHPMTVLRDVPSAFGPFSPENFDGRFLGPVTATDALNRSRNIPAVAVAARLRDPNLYGFLRQAGIGPLASESHYGLALVLGGGEVSPRELAMLYAMLGNGGVQRRLRYQRDSPIDGGQRLISEAAAFMTLDMLRRNRPRDDSGAARPRRLPVAWKTGTSWGFRDAWTAATVGPYVLVVWVGRFDGVGNPALIGIEAAAPLAFAIVDAILADDPHLGDPPWRVPDRLRRVEICLATGELPNAWCPQRGETWFIPGISPITVSQVHRAVTIDIATGRAACPPFDPARTRTEIFEYWPSELARVFADAGMPRRTPPEPAVCGPAATTEWAGGTALRIDRPLTGVAYGLRSSHPEQAVIEFRASTEAPVADLYWFVDDAYVGVSGPGTALAWRPPGPGRFRVRVVDGHGNADHRELRVDALD